MQAQPGQTPTHDPAAEAVVDHPEGAETRVSTRLGFGTQAVTAPGDTSPVMPLPMSPPWMKIVHGVGKASKLGFAPGTLIIGKEPDSTPIAQPKTERYAGDALKIIIWDYEYFFKQYAYTEGQVGKRFKTKAEAEAAGFTTERNPVTGELPTAPLAMTWLLLVEKPKDLICERFFLEVGDKAYAPCFFELDKKGFRAVHDSFQLMVFATKKTPGGLKAVEWELRTRVAPATKGDGVCVPQIRKIRIIPAEELTRIVEATAMLAGAPAEAGAPEVDDPAVQTPA